jgi:hypothetical protein
LECGTTSRSGRERQKQGGVAENGKKTFHLTPLDSHFFFFLFFLVEKPFRAKRTTERRNAQSQSDTEKKKKDTGGNTTDDCVTMVARKFIW